MPSLSPNDSNRAAAPLLESSKHLLKANGSIIGREVAECILPHFQTFCSAIPLSTGHALASIDGRSPLSHRQIHDFILNEFGPTLHQLGFGKGDRIALVLPNGPELALAIVSTAQWASCVPLNANGAHSELEADLLRCGADLVIGPYSGPIMATAPAAGHASNDQFQVMSGPAADWSVFRHVEESANKLNIPFVGLVPSPTESGVFKLVPTRHDAPFDFTAPMNLKSIRTNSTKTISHDPNNASSEVLVLFTSGTTGNKKLVPHQLGDMLTAAATIALSWNLTFEDVNCNLMPLFHVGGIVRQVFSPLVSASCVICCPSFDPSIFWALLEKKAFTWYYAAPTMHQLILQTGNQLCDGSSTTNPTMTLEQRIQPRLRMIANAAGGLLPSLATQLQDVFGANVLPSYGMTECMPISSPPATYQLEKPGTSGVAVGPELAILNTCTGEAFAPGVEGPICVRGAPCFRGYGQIANDPTGTVVETFMKDGWFNTGDLGYLDEDGYLFITGRSKEVINRGGEIISPMEVEEEILSHPHVAACAAFSAPHSVMQEVVGIVLVMAPGCPRLDLPSLHEYLGERLAAPKWPQCLVFMDGLPKSHTNKLLRVKLGDRLGIPELNDEMSPIERTFEAKCPPQGTSLDVLISSSTVSVSAVEVQSKLLQEMSLKMGELELMVVPHPTRVGALVCHVWNVNRLEVIRVAQSVLDRYAVPSHFVEYANGISKELTPPQTMDATASILQQISSTEPVDPLVSAVQEIFTDMLGLDYLPGPDANFFHLGGSSMLASQLASKIRKRFDVPCSGAEVFHHVSANDIAKMVRERSGRRGDSGTVRTSPNSEPSNSIYDDSSASENSYDNHADIPFPSTRLAPEGGFFANLIQLIPIFLIFPVWQVSRYLLFFRFLLWSLDVQPNGRDFFTFVGVYFCFHLCWVTITPLIFVGIKWMVIGRYKAGRYPIWGSYYLRWWFVDICRKLFLRGIWGSNEFLLNIYYRMLGADIGKGARISLEADVAEYDLVSIGDEAAIEHCTLRAFGVDNGAIILGPVRVGNDASVGVRSVIAPHTSIPDDAHLGPVTSSYETGKALDYKHARVNRKYLPEPSLFMQLFVGSPIMFLVNCFGQIPPLLILLWMLWYKDGLEEFETLGDLIDWLCDPCRIPFYLGIRISRAVLTPFFYMGPAILVKKYIIGKFEPGPRNTWNQWELLRHWLSATLLSRKKIQAVTDIVGRHYELVSVLYRLLGAKVGKRVFWPGHQPVFSGEFDLLEVGDDVVFGSRSSIFFATTDSCEKVILCAGSNVADNCVVLPGSIVGKRAVLGSNSVCPEGWYLPEYSVWFGSTGCEPMCLDKGTDPKFAGQTNSSQVNVADLPMVGDASTLSPFGKAFYKRQASYFVLPLSFIVSFSVFMHVFIATFHALPLLGAMHGMAAMLYGIRFDERDYDGLHYSFATVYVHVLFVFFWAHLIRIFLWLVIELCAKWGLMGRRKPGRYNYDVSSYGQRWEMYQLIGKVRKFNRLNFLDFLSGTPMMNLYFRLNGSTLGKDVCLYPSGADPFMPEPDLVVIGDRCVIDCASIVSHLNTRGNFELATITMENDCTLRTRSRIQQAVYMEQGSQLLEKSLAMTGEVIEANSVWKGGPASFWFQYFTRSKKSKISLPDTEYSSDEEVYNETSNLINGKVKVYLDV